MPDTIFALSSGPLPAGVAVLRISGPGCRDAGQALLGALPPPRVATVCPLRDPVDGSLIDRGLVLWFPGPRSFTGEDVLELHLHGSRAVLQAALRVLGTRPGLRMAEPGEFSRRAFLNGKMDLIEAEGLADLIAAQTEAQRRQAMRQSEGALSREADAWRGELLDMLATVAAALDFSDEGDVDVVSAAEVAERSRRLATSIAAALDGARQGELIRQGATVVLAGPPNAGKSSLLNALARRDVALVSPHAGTTRDLIEVALDLRGLPVVVVDTAGLRDARDPVEQMGIERTRSRAARADLVLWLTETGADPPADLSHAIPVRTKLDLSSPVGVGSRTLAVSVLSGEGIDALLDWIHQRVAALAGGGEPALVTHERQRQLLQRALAVLRGISHDMPLEILAEHLRLATVALAELVGRLDVEEVLGAVFGRFCIGK